MKDVILAFTADVDSALWLLVNTMVSELSDEVAPFLALLIAVTLAFYFLKMAATGVFDTMGVVYFVARSSLILSLIHI